eukprot:1227039-Amphidinium_carterae.1
MKHGPPQHPGGRNFWGMCQSCHEAHESRALPSCSGHHCIKLLRQSLDGIVRQVLTPWDFDQWFTRGLYQTHTAQAAAK